MLEYVHSQDGCLKVPPDERECGYTQCDAGRDRMERLVMQDPIRSEQKHVMMRHSRDT